MEKLTSKQELFCREYLVDLNATQAAIRAGYNPNSAKQIATENLSKPYLANFIAELKAERAAKVDISAAWVLKKLVALHDKCMEAETVQDSAGVDMGYAKFNPSSAAKSLELIGRHVDVRAFDVDEKNQGSTPISINIVNPNADSADQASV